MLYLKVSCIPNPSTLKIAFVILVTVCHIIPVMLVLRFGTGSTKKNPQTYTFLHSHQLLDIVLIS